MLSPPPSLTVSAGTTLEHPHISQGPVHSPSRRAGWALHIQTHSLAEGQWGGKMFPPFSIWLCSPP